MLTTEEKTKIISKYKLHGKDTGSAEVQIAILTEEIGRLADHLKKHEKDHHSRRGLLQMVIKRKRLLDWLRRESSRRYNALTKRLSLRK
jgi:small subunit ribosomal protein S15